MPRWTWIIAVVGALYLQYRLWIGPGGYLDVAELQARVDAAQQQNEFLQQRNDAIETEITRLETDPAAIEYHARVDLGMIKPGESFYLIVH
jgi:cell division protein FtsB